MYWYDTNELWIAIYFKTTNFTYCTYKTIAALPHGIIKLVSFLLRTNFLCVWPHSCLINIRQEICDDVAQNTGHAKSSGVLTAIAGKLISVWQQIFNLKMIGSQTSITKFHYHHSMVWSQCCFLRKFELTSVDAVLDY